LFLPAVHFLQIHKSIQSKQIHVLQINGISLSLPFNSMLVSSAAVFLGCHATLPAKKELGESCVTSQKTAAEETNSMSDVMIGPIENIQLIMIDYIDWYR